MIKSRISLPAQAVLQWRALPDHGGHTEDRGGVPAQWRTVAANRPFLLFSAAMIGSSLGCAASPAPDTSAPGTGPLQGEL
ncbi:hypothetical protein ACH40E_43270 [Streptomyces acidicola]|uniref:hypothetical protein n=1 Tax=Streptomyces acidicola TaxID=2596892 RepID=UPI00379CD592